ARDGIRAAASSSSRGGIYATASGSEPGPEAEGSAAGGGFVWPDNASAASADSNADPIGGSGRGGRVYAIAAIAGAAGRVGSSAGCATTTYVSHAIAVCRASHACTCAVCGSAACACFTVGYAAIVAAERATADGIGAGRIYAGDFRLRAARFAERARGAGCGATAACTGSRAGMDATDAEGAGDAANAWCDCAGDARHGSNAGNARGNAAGRWRRNAVCAAGVRDAACCAAGAGRTTADNITKVPAADSGAECVFAAGDRADSVFCDASQMTGQGSGVCGRDVRFRNGI